MGVLHTTNRKKLAFLGGLVLLAALVLRRRGRRDAVEIEIDERRMRSVAIDEPPSEGVDDDDEPAVELESIEGVGPAYASRLRDAGIADGADLVAADVDELAAETGIGERRIRGWTERVGDSGDG